ncbi:hypothetical protein MCHI_003976 [Candidatus Magnetoovum chiemensis]|nr:hypothetical protein MCHI_003976 [Candidatus Magnetoovum chiemensis]
MDIINQPRAGKLGDKLIELLGKSGSERFNIFYIMVAYIRKSGVIRLERSIENFKSVGGIVKSIVGIDQKNSSIEGIQMLAGLSNEMFIFHNEDPNMTFHPKLYIFEKENVRAIVLIGSGNLTGGGLYTNYELKSIVEFDLTQFGERREFEGIKSVFISYSDTSSPLCKIATPEQIRALIDSGYIIGENSLATQNREINRINSSSARERIFGSESIISPRIETTVEGEEAKKITGGEYFVEDAFPKKGQLLWNKSDLPSSDAQQVTSGSNITGVLRFSKAKFKKNNVDIDHKIYFINEVFNKLYWYTQVRTNKQPLLVAEALFQININNRFLGEFTLKISHDPERISGQNNVPTTLHWGELISKIQQANIVGKNLFLYAAPDNFDEPFFIEIN